MAAPYIPPRDVDLKAWADNFSTLITATPAAFGLAPADAAIIAAATLAYDIAFNAGGSAALVPVNPTTRTPVTVADKNTAKQALLPIVRGYASQIRLNPGVSNMDKTALRLNLPNNTPSPIPAPSTSPLLSFIGATPGQHTLRYADQNTPSSRAKPQNVVALQLYLGVDTVALTNPLLCILEGTETKQPVAVTFSNADRGKIATYFARWITRRGLTGPWSNAISAVIPGT